MFAMMKKNNRAAVTPIPGAPAPYDYERLRHGGWFLTSTGKQFFPLDPRAEDICIEDIAHALSNVCRFGGHCRDFYSVAQHSVHVSDLVPPEHAMLGLMHDATEAYIGDMVRPLKLCMPDYQEAEARLWTVIAAKFGLPEIFPGCVKEADNVALMTERRDLVIHTPHVWSVKAEPDEAQIRAWSPRLAKKHFLNRYRELKRRTQYEITVIE